jgi:hypothetical protein
VEELRHHKDDLWEVLVGIDEWVSELVRGQEELGDRVVQVEQRGWSPDTWTVVEGESVVGEGMRLRWMQWRRGRRSWTRQRLGCKLTLCRNLPLGESS